MPGVALSYYASASQRRLDLIGRSLRSLDRGRLHEAYVLADMSCQCRRPAVEDLLLRGEIAARLGFASLERADVEAAFAIDPSLPAAQVRMLALLCRWGEAGAADAVARAILRLDPQPDVIRIAVAALVCGDDAEGIAWSRAGPAGLEVTVVSVTPLAFEITVDFEQRSERHGIRAAADHALADVLGYAGSISLRWPEYARTARLTSERPLDWTGAPAFRPFHPGPARPSRPPERCQQEPASATVIMPVYADLDMTRAAIDSVLSARPDALQRLVLIDDCGPDPALRARLVDYARLPGVDLIVNPINLGFIGSVNRALLDYPDGDVVLLNADCIVASGWLERLSRAAHSRPGIGTATPLSNHGELTSVPAPFDPVSMPDPSEITAIDRAASELNAGLTVDLPNGVGFCIYITQACRHATGLLNDVDYREGYGEEVEYCLRASELGFSHVCACDVFVGHAGGRSFQARKRSLSTHNLATLERSFPDVRGVTERFIAADPLRSTRDTLQRRLLIEARPRCEPVTLVIGRHAIPAPGTPDLPSVVALGMEGPLLRLGFDRRGGAMLHREGAMAPYRLALDLRTGDPSDELVALLRGQGVERIMYLGAGDPPWVRSLPAQLGVAYDVIAVDDSVLRPCEMLVERRAFLDGARRFVSASPGLCDLSEKIGQRRPDHAPLHFEAPPVYARTDAADGPVGLAVFLDASDGTAWCRVQDLGRAIMRNRSPLRLVVFGATRDDDALQRTGAVTVAGMPAPALASAAFALHRCAATIAFLPDDRIEYPDLPVIALGPRPLLSWNSYLADVLGYGEGDYLSFTADQPVDLVLGLITDALDGRHG